MRADYISICVEENEKLKAEVIEKDRHIAKLVKEKFQPKDSPLSQQNQSVKEASSVGIQFNYLIPSMGKE